MVERHALAGGPGHGRLTCGTHNCAEHYCAVAHDRYSRILDANEMDGVVGLEAKGSTGRGGRQRLEKVGQRGLSKAAAYVLEQRGPYVMIHVPAPGATPVITRDLPFDEKRAFERISQALREMTEFVAPKAHVPSSGDDRATATAD
jgi:hypothetical protein